VNTININGRQGPARVLFPLPLSHTGRGTDEGAGFCISFYKSTVLTYFTTVNILITDTYSHINKNVLTFSVLVKYYIILRDNNNIVIIILIIIIKTVFPSQRNEVIPIQRLSSEVQRLKIHYSMIVSTRHAQCKNNIQQ